MVDTNQKVPKLDKTNESSLETIQKKSFEEIDKLINTDINSDQWTFRVEQNNQIVHTMSDPTYGIDILRSEGYINLPIEEALKLQMWDDDAQQKLDPNCEIFDTKEVLYDKYILQYFKSTEQFKLVAARDCLYMFSKESYKNGYRLAGCSVQDDDYPPLNGVVRGEMYKWGQYLEKDKNDPENKTHCLFFIQFNLNGYVPKFLVNLFITEAGFLYQKINNYLSTNSKIVNKFEMKNQLKMLKEQESDKKSSQEINEQQNKLEEEKEKQQDENSTSWYNPNVLNKITGFFWK